MWLGSLLAVATTRCTSGRTMMTRLSSLASRCAPSTTLGPDKTDKRREGWTGRTHEWHYPRTRRKFVTT